MARTDLLRLLAGFRKFHDRYFDKADGLYQKLSSIGQSPKTLVIGCSDSRVDPAILTSAAPGDLFVVRNVANLIPPFEEGKGFHGISSAIEFAVVNLKVENIVILGHRQCGGIRALMAGQQKTEGSFVGMWMQIAKEARDRVLATSADADFETQCRECEKESIAVSAQNLKTFPFVRDALRERELTILGAYFDLELGELLELDEATGKFHAVDLSRVPADDAM